MIADSQNDPLPEVEPLPVEDREGDAPVLGRHERYRGDYPDRGRGSATASASR